MDSLPRYIEVASALEFSRLVCALERTPHVSFMHEHEGRKVLSVQMDILMDKPVIYYTPLDDAGHYLCYGFRSGQEESFVADSTADSSMLYSPIVRIRSLPRTLMPGNGTDAKYHPIVLEDLLSLAKLSYGLEETPFPLFSFPRGGGWLLGAFMNFAEDGSSYFCHVALDREPRGSFMKFAASGGGQPSFVDSPDEHGYSYIKLVKLSGAHPLVDYDQLQN